jgi:hypothetical protein
MTTLQSMRFPGPGSLVKIAHSRKFAVAGNYWAAGGTFAGVGHWPGWRRPMPRYYFDILDIKEGHRLVNPSGLDFKNDGAAIARAKVIAIGVAIDKPAVDPKRHVAVLNGLREEIFRVPVYSKPSISHT